MTSVAESPAAAADHDHDHDHPGLALYWKIGAVLAVLTALEVSTYWWPEGAATSAVLIVLMIVKFALVALYFMHLKFDSKLLRSVFMGGMILAIGIYLATLSAMTFWVDSGTPEWKAPPRAKPIPAPVEAAPSGGGGAAGGH